MYFCLFACNKINKKQLGKKWSSFSPSISCCLEEAWKKNYSLWWDALLRISILLWWQNSLFLRLTTPYIAYVSQNSLFFCSFFLVSFWASSSHWCFNNVTCPEPVLLVRHRRQANSLFFFPRLCLFIFSKIQNRSIQGQFSLIFSIKVAI